MEILTREEVHQIIHERSEGRRKLVEALRRIKAISTSLNCGFKP